MTRTRTLVIIGCFMLVLAVLAALELRSGESVLSEGQTVTGALSKESPVPLPPVGQTPTSLTPPSTPQQAALPEEPLPAKAPVASSGALLPLDNGTLRASNVEPAMTSSVMMSPTPPAPAGPATPPRVAEQEKSKPTVEPTSAPLNEKGKEALQPVKTVPATSEQDKPKIPVATAPSVPTTGITDQAPAMKQQEVAKAEADKAPQKAATTENKAGGSKIITTRAPEKLLPGESSVIWTHLELGGKEVVFRFTGATALDGKGFLLADPPRFVVDLQGSWGIQLPRVPTNELLKAIRAGRQDANTRLVFDLSRPLSNCQVQRVNKETLEVRIR